MALGNAARTESRDDQQIWTYLTTVTDNGDGTFTLGGWLRGLRGTPSLVVGDALIPGAVEFDQLSALVDRMTESCQVC